MRHLTLGEVLTLHARVLKESGGGERLRDLGALQSAVSATLRWKSSWY